HSAASDLYAATAVFFESMTGAPPYAGSELAGLSRAHQRAAVPAEAVPPVARPLVVAGLAKDPRDRPPAAAQFRRDLDVVARSVLGATWRDNGRVWLAGAAEAPGHDRRPPRTPPPLPGPANQQEGRVVLPDLGRSASAGAS